MRGGDCMFGIFSGLVAATVNTGVSMFSKGILSALVITTVSRGNSRANLSLKD